MNHLTQSLLRGVGSGRGFCLAALTLGIAFAASAAQPPASDRPGVPPTDAPRTPPPVTGTEEPSGQPEAAPSNSASKPTTPASEAPAAASESEKPPGLDDKPAWEGRKPPEIPTDLTAWRELPYGPIDLIDEPALGDDPRSRVFVDLKEKLLVAEGRVVLREGPLEMFACPFKTKEHESVVSIYGKASHVHAGLLMIGAKPGGTVRYEPEYRPAFGDIIEVWVAWSDRDGRVHVRPAQEWVKSAATEKPMPYDWVFAGGRFVRDRILGRDLYSGDGGDFICVSNFPSAALDIPVPSTDTNDGLLFLANTEKVPPLETPVRLIFRVGPRPQATPVRTVPFDPSRSPTPAIFPSELPAEVEPEMPAPTPDAGPQAPPPLAPAGDP